MKESVDNMNNELVKEIENFKKTFSKPNTRKNYGSDLRLFFEYMEKEYNMATIEELKDIKPMHVRTYLAFMKEGKGKNVKSSGYANSSINRRKSAIIKFFDFLTKNKILIVENPARDIENYEVNNRHNIYLRKETLVKFIKYVQTRKPKKGERMVEFAHKRDLAMFLLVLKTGLRAEEVCNLEIKDISFKTGMINIKDRKNNLDNEVQINEKELKVLKEYLESRDKLKKREDDYVFLSVFGKQLDDKSLNKILKKYISEIGMENEGITFHKLRHSFAHFYLKNGGNMKGLQMALGHKNPSTTNIYAHLDTEDVFEPMNKLDLID